MPLEQFSGTSAPNKLIASDPRWRHCSWKLLQIYYQSCVDHHRHRINQLHTGTHRVGRAAV